MKKCPYCAEEIQDEAIICRYCGRELDPIKVKAITTSLDEIDKEKALPKVPVSASDRLILEKLKKMDSTQAQEPVTVTPNSKTPTASLKPSGISQVEKPPLPENVNAIIRDLKRETLARKTAIVRAQHLDRPYPEVISTLEVISTTSLYADEKASATNALRILRSKLADTKKLPFQPLFRNGEKSVFQESYLESDSWYARGRFGGLALIVAIGAGLYAFDSGDMGAMAIAIIAGLFALSLLGGRGIVSKIITWIVFIGLLALCGTFVD